MGVAKLFLDVNIILDFFDSRPFELEETEKIIAGAALRKVELFISESVVTNVLYLSKIPDLNYAMERLLQLAIVLPTSNAIIKTALASPFKDKEDAILYYLAVAHKMDVFVTRDAKDFVPFALSQAVVLTPTEVVAHYLI